MSSQHSAGKRPKLLSKSSSSLSLGKYKPLTKKPISSRSSKPTSAKGERESEVSEKGYLSPDDVMRPQIFPIIEGLLPPELDYARAKAFLMKTSSVTNICLYDHLVELLRRILRQQPRNAVDLFETISYEMKYDRLEALSNKNGFAKPESETFEKSKTSMELFKNLNSEMSKPSKERRSSALVRPKDLISIVRDIKICTPFKSYLSLLQDYALGISQEEYYSIYASLTLFTKTKPIQDISFWGKIYGTYCDYFIAEAPYEPNSHWDEIEIETLMEEGELDIDFSLDTPQPNTLFQGSENENLCNDDILKKLRLKPIMFIPPEKPGVGVNQFIYFACTKLGEPWIKLPYVTPEQLSVAKLIKKNFTGVFNAPVISYPPFPGKEIHLLRAQIARIAASTSVSPIGYFRITEEKLKPSGIKYSLAKEEEYEGLPLHELETPDLNKWVHHRHHILPQGRCTWMRPCKETTEEPSEEIEEKSVIADEFYGPVFEEESKIEKVEKESKRVETEEQDKPVEGGEESKPVEEEETVKPEETEEQPEEAKESSKQGEAEEETKPEETEEPSKPEEAEGQSKAEEAEGQSKAEEAEEPSKPEEAEGQSKPEGTEEPTQSIKAEESSKMEEAAEPTKEEEAEEPSKAEEAEPSKAEEAEPSKADEAEEQSKAEVEQQSKAEELEKRSKAEKEESKEGTVKRQSIVAEMQDKSKPEEAEEQSKEEEKEEQDKQEDVQSRKTKSVRLETGKTEREADEEEFLGVDDITRGPPLMMPLSEDIVAEGIQPWTIFSTSRLLPQHSVVVLKSNIWPGAHVFSDGKLMENVYVGFGVKQDGIPYSPQLPPFPSAQYPSNCVKEKDDVLPEEDVEYQKYLRGQRALARKKLREEKYEKVGKRKKKKKKKYEEEARGEEEVGPGKEEVTRDYESSAEKEASGTRSVHSEGENLEEMALEDEGHFEDDFLMEDELSEGFLSTGDAQNKGALSSEESESDID